MATCYYLCCETPKEICILLSNYIINTSEETKNWELEKSPLSHKQTADCPSWLRPKWAEPLRRDWSEPGLLIDGSAPFLNKTQVKQLNDDGGTFSAAPGPQVK